MSYSIDCLKQMNIKELEELSNKIREDLINSLSKTGGHLSSNLGVVELTIALHYVFNSPKDMFIFDVSHQTYVHKMLTGRFEKFDKLRMLDGLSGFSSKDESIHDVYETGHSSTSISAALGFLEAKKENNELFDNIISIIGDASIVNGLSMEALNYLGSKLDQKMIIILNDNEMGISKNVGGLARTFNKIRVKNRFKLIRKLTPKFIKKMMKSVAYRNTPFSGFGLKYLGVIDGHNIKELIEYLEYAKKCPTSVVLHVKTQKGKGFKFASSDNTGAWHSIQPFDKKSGIQQISKYDSFSFGERIAEVLSSEIIKGNRKIRVLTAGMPYGCGLTTFASTYPENFIDVGIAEENAIVMASSMGSAGIIPFVFIYSTFLQRAYDEIIHDLARNNAHAIICVDRAGIVSGDGATHQGIYDVGYLNTIPNLVVLAPTNLLELDEMVKHALNNPKTYVIRYPKNSFEVGNNDYFELGHWNILKESENSKYIITYGPNVSIFKENLKLSKVGLINASTIKPIDRALISKLVKEHNSLYFYEEVSSSGSMYQYVLTFINELYLDGEIDKFKIKSKSLPDTYLTVGNKEELVDLYNLQIEKYIKEVEED